MSRATDLSEHLELWWVDFERTLRGKGRSPRTAKNYREGFENFWRWVLAQEAAIDRVAVTLDVVNGWVDSMREAGLAPATVGINWRGVRAFFAW